MCHGNIDAHILMREHAARLQTRTLPVPGPVPGPKTSPSPAEIGARPPLGPPAEAGLVARIKRIWRRKAPRRAAEVL